MLFKYDLADSIVVIQFPWPLLAIIDKIFAFDFLFTTCFDVRRSVQVVVSERMVKIPKDFRLHNSTPRKVKVGAKIKKKHLKN